MVGHMREGDDDDDGGYDGGYHLIKLTICQALR